MAHVLDCVPEAKEISVLLFKVQIFTEFPHFQCLVHIWNVLFQFH